VRPGYGQLDVASVRRSCRKGASAVGSLRDPSDAARVFGPAKIAAWVTLALMLVTVVYSIVMSLANWSEIGV